MTTYRSYTELRGKTLSYGDEVLFQVDGKGYLYQVSDEHLSGQYIEYRHCSNEAIFNVLKIDKHPFCCEHYGYRPSEGTWPESKDQDFEALTRVVLALFKLCDNKGIEIRKGWII